MHMTVYAALVLCLLASHASVAIGLQVEIPGRCTDVCSTDVEDVFFSCVDEIDRGCALQLCDRPRNAAKCSLRSGIPEVLFTGEEVRLLDFRVSRSMKTSIEIARVVPKVDVYFLVDGTGSVGPAIGAFRRAFRRLTAALKEFGDFGYGVGLFRDETELDMGFRNLQGITTDVDLAKDSVDTLRSRGGGDTEEANLVALYKIATGDFVKWREGASRIVLLFGDAVGHEPTCFDDVVLNRRVVVRALNAAGIALNAIGAEISALDDSTTQFGCGRGRAGRGQTTFLTNRTGGTLTSLAANNVPSILRTFTEVLGSPTAIVDIAESSCGRGFRFFFDPPLPAPLGPDGRLKTTIRLRRRVCRTGTFACSIKFQSGHSVSEALSFTVSDPLGCP